MTKIKQDAIHHLKKLNLENSCSEITTNLFRYNPEALKILIEVCELKLDEIKNGFLSMQDAQKHIKGAFNYANKDLQAIHSNYADKLDKRLQERRSPEVRSLLATRNSHLQERYLPSTSVRSFRPLSIDEKRELKKRLKENKTSR